MSLLREMILILSPHVSIMYVGDAEMDDGTAGSTELSLGGGTVRCKVSCFGMFCCEVMPCGM